MPTPSIARVSAFLDRRCRTDAADEHDNVGLLAGDPQAAVRRVTVCLDLSPAVVARSRAAQLVVCYHPPIYRPVARIRADQPTTAAVHAALRAGLALYSPHTGLDVADGGTSDTMADLLGLRDVGPLAPQTRSTGQYKLATFCPPESTEAVRAGLCDAGAGVIGAYSQCAFRGRGRGSFRGDATSNPVVGRAEQLEFVDEDRLEVLVPAARLEAVLAALRATHPYEEAAYDLYPLTTRHAGIGRVGVLARPLSVSALAKQAARAFGRRAVRVATPARARAVRRVAVSPGAGGSFVSAVLRSGVDALVTGELSHHAARELAAGGVAAVCVGHGASERPVLDRLAAWLRAEFRGLRVTVDAAEAEPFEDVLK